MSRLPLCLVFALLLSVGCGDDDGGPVDSGPPPVDQCQNTVDIAIANASVPVPDGGFLDAGRTDGLVSDEAVLNLTYAVADCSAGSCGSLILQESPELDTCMAECLVGTVAQGLSPDCTHCWVELVGCMADHCLVLCADDVYSVGCSDCSNTYCAPRFSECTGFQFVAP